MVSFNDKLNMSDFLVARLEDSKRYLIISKDNSHVLLKQKDELAETPITIDVILHNYKRTTDEYKRLRLANYQKEIYTADLFYKDEDNFMKWLAKDGVANFKRDNRSLKLYNDEIKNMIHLRSLEKNILSYLTKKILAYYQPKSDRLPEGIRIEKITPVTLNYSHVTKDVPSYSFVQENMISKDYALTTELAYIKESGIWITKGNNSPNARVAVIIPSKE
jgi:hypothetical protein